MKKTKIICSIGPVSNSVEVMEQLAINGMNCARINMSHANKEDMLNTIEVVRETRRRTNMPIAIMYDTKGPEFRTLNFEGDGVELKTNDTIKMIKRSVLGNYQEFSVNHPEAIDYINIGNHVLVDNALLDLEVVEKGKDYVLLKALNDGAIKNHKTINVPGINLNLDFISDIDKKDITFAAQHSCDYLALSFVNSAEDVRQAKKIVSEAGGDARIISKIESQMGIENIDIILASPPAVVFLTRHHQC